MTKIILGSTYSKHQKSQLQGFQCIKYAILVFLTFLLISLKVKSYRIISSYFFGNSNTNSVYLQDAQEDPPAHPINSHAGPSTCSLSYANNPSIDPFCIITKNGLLFPKTLDSNNYMEGGLEYYSIIDADPYYSLLIRIFVNPTLVDSDDHNRIKFKLFFQCKHYIEIGFDIHFINPKQIKLYVHTFIFDEDACCNGEGTNFESVAPFITSPTWIDAAMHFEYAPYSHIPFCLTEKVYQTGLSYSFNIERLNPLFSNDVDQIGIDLLNSSLKIIVSKKFGMTIQYIGILI